MTFGYVKSRIESNLIDSYKNEKEFRKTLREFKENVLKNKELSKVYSLYDQLSTPQGLNPKDAEDFLNEGVNLINKILPKIKLPITSDKSKENQYTDIDNLVYTNKFDIKERVQSKKNILRVLTTEPKKINETVNIPVSSMVKIANQTLENYIDTMDSESKKIFMSVIKNDKNNLEKEYSSLKENTLKKLNNILSEEKEADLKTKITETIDKLQSEEFTQINYVKLISLDSGL